MSKRYIGQEVKSLRKGTGLSQEKFAKAINIPYKTYQQWEYNKVQTDDEILNTIKSIISSSNLKHSGKVKKRYYNNGIKNIMISDGDAIPDGFVPGMVKKSKKDKSSINERRKKTNLDKYGSEFPMQSKIVQENTKQTNLNRYGVENISQAKEVQDKRRNTFIERYGSTCSFNSREIQKKIKQTNKSMYGTENPFSSNIIQKKIVKTNVKKYGVEWACMRPEARIGSNNSLPNRKFSDILDRYDIPYEREFSLKSYSYDFKIGNILVEIDPSATHNELWFPFGNHESHISKDYHYRKLITAEENGYRCIHVFDWESMEKVVWLLQSMEKLYARKCHIIQDVDKGLCKEFLNTYHLQNSCNGQVIRIGLEYSNNLVSVMTFGKPRYNRHYEYELLRYCSIKAVIGGAEKMFKEFVNTYHSNSLISYCDRSKFTGDVYKKLGMKLISSGNPSKHWYSPKEKRHITDNFLRQHGYDRIFNESHGKGTSNEELIIQRGYIPVYDCGQDTYVWSSDKM